MVDRSARSKLCIVCILNIVDIPLQNPTCSICSMTRARKMLNNARDIDRDMRWYAWKFGAYEGYSVDIPWIFRGILWHCPDNDGYSESIF